MQDTGSLLTYLYSAAMLGGVIYSIYDMISHNRPTKVLWLIVIILFPFGWLIYIFAARADDAKNNTQSQHAVAATTDETLAKPTVPTPLGQSAAPQPATYISKPIKKQRSAFQIIGTVLAIVSIVGGLIVVGFVILFALALASWGNSK